MPSEHDLQTRVTAVRDLKAATSGEDCLVVIHSPVQTDFGKRYLLTAASVSIGRGIDNDIVLVSDSVSRRHARIERRGDALYVADLGSTNGTLVNDAQLRARECALSNGDQVKFGDFVLKHLSGTNVEAQYHDVVFGMAITDALTNLSNRRQLDAVLTREVVRAERQGNDLAVLMFDIDHFKGINDTFGHQAGDAVLAVFANLLRKRLRPTDELGRYGGEEFCAVLPGIPLATARAVAEELRRTIESHPFTHEGRRIKVTVSVGVCGWRAGIDMACLYRAADEMLYTAKRSGRNRVCGGG
jgi:two-component system cell cycle response regulator